MAARLRLTRGALGFTGFLCALVVGCGAQAPAAPGPVGAAAITGLTDLPAPAPTQTGTSESLQARARTSHNFDLLEGALTLTLADGSVLRGTYHGAASIPSSGQPRASLEGVVTGGTGLFAGATGGITGTGTGGFAGDGEFSVALRAAVWTPDGESLDVRATLKGFSTSTCTTTAPPRMALDGTGRAKGLASVSGHLEHDLGTAICAIIVE